MGLLAVSRTLDHADVISPLALFYFESLHCFVSSQVREVVLQISGPNLKIASFKKCFENAGSCRYGS